MLICSHDRLMLQNLDYNCESTIESETMASRDITGLRKILPIAVVATSLMCLAGCDSGSDVGAVVRQIAQPVRLS